MSSRDYSDDDSALRPVEMVSLKTLAAMLDADRSTVRRWLSDAGVPAVAIGQGRNGAIRYRLRDVRQWLESCGDVA